MEKTTRIFPGWLGQQLKTRELSEIARNLKTTEEAVQEFIDQHGTEVWDWRELKLVKPEKRKPFAERANLQDIKTLLPYHTTAELAKMYNIGVQTMQNYLNKHNLSSGVDRRLSPLYRLDPAQVTEFAASHSLAECCRQFKVSTITMVKFLEKHRAKPRGKHRSVLSLVHPRDVQNLLYTCDIKEVADHFKVSMPTMRNYVKEHDLFVFNDFNLINVAHELGVSVDELVSAIRKAKEEESFI